MFLFHQLLIRKTAWGLYILQAGSSELRADWGRMVACLARPSAKFRWSRWKTMCGFHLWPGAWEEIKSSSKKSSFLGVGLQGKMDVPNKVPRWQHGAGGPKVSQLQHEHGKSPHAPLVSFRAGTGDHQFLIKLQGALLGLVEQPHKGMYQLYHEYGSSGASFPLSSIALTRKLCKYMDIWGSILSCCHLSLLGRSSLLAVSVHEDAQLYALTGHRVQLGAGRKPF